MRKYTHGGFLYPIFIYFIFISNGMAKEFTNQYLSFTLPSGWECALEGTEWVCQSHDKARKKEAIIIMAAKIRGDHDSLDDYKIYLRKTKTFSLPGGKTQISDAKYAKAAIINKHQWIDALHMASEVPGFYTRYLATVKNDLGVAVTLSVSKDHYQKYKNLFDKLVKTLIVFRQKKQKLNIADLNINTNEVIEFIPDEVGNSDIKIGQQSGGKQDDKKDYLSYLWLFAISIFIWPLLKLRKAKKRK